MGDKPKVKGRISIDIWVECPKCGEDYIDLFDLDYINDEGQLWSVVQSNDWENLDMEFECPKCKAELVFDKLEY